jgi:hypothetical protein
MATDNVTPICPSTDEPDAFDGIYDRMQQELDALRCVRVILGLSGEIDADDDLSAARGLLHRSWQALDDLHSALATWHMRERAP